MNAIAKMETTALATMAEGELLDVLQSSLYPGANLNSIKMVLGYCKAAGLDPMQKPVHIVPMKVSSGQKDDRGYDIKVDRDVIMPGVGLYRTQAARSGAYAGVSDPEFGPTRKLSFKADRWEEDGGRRVKRTVDDAIEYPEWCRVSVTRIVDGQPREFSAREYWLENYATKGASSSEPNAMWKKRPFGQIAKCAEAQALRKAFPEMTGAQPTADEMEGQAHHDDAPRERNMGAADVVGAPPAPPAPEPKAWADDKLEIRLGKMRKAFAEEGKTADDAIQFLGTIAALSEAQTKRIRAVHAECVKKPEVIDADTGEVVERYAAVADAINKAGDADALAAAEDRIRFVQADQQADLRAIAARRATELEG